MFKNVMTAALLLVILHASAHTKVYRCDNGGKVSYASVPCADGAGGVELAAPAAGDAVPAGMASATGSLQRQKALADQLMRERHQREAAEDRERKLAAARRLQCDKLQLRKKWRDEDAAKASASARAKMQREARRSAEELALSCPS